MKTLFVLFLFASSTTTAQPVATYISKGNDYYLQLQFDLAETQYRQAVEKAPKNVEARYNLANALMQQKKYKAAIEMYEGVIAGDDEKLKAIAYYNTGVSYSKQQDLPASIEAYKNALRMNPADNEARENLQKALYEQRQQQQQNKQNKGGMDPKQADEKLKELQQKEKELKKKMQQGQGKGNGGGKDW